MPFNFLLSGLVAGLSLGSLVEATSSPVQHIDWKPCQITNGSLPLTCATFKVPLDYANNTSKATLALPMAKISATKSPSKGAIIANFGGPGELGRLSMAEVSQDLRTLTGGYYDIIGFDNRGTGTALPFSCYANEVGRETAQLQTPLESNSSDTAIGYQWSASTNFAEACYALNNETGTLIGTAYTARDIMEMSKVLNSDGKLRYWGFSYGTTLGATLAAMFPDQVASMVLDGVFNPYEYYYSYSFQEYADTDSTIRAMFEACAKAGPTKCALAYKNSTGAGIEDRFYRLLDVIKYQPIPLAGTLITYDLVKSVTLSMLYGPASYPELAALLAALETGNLAGIAQYSASVSGGQQTLVNESLQGIQCGDKYSRISTLADFEPVIVESFNASRFAGGSIPLTSMQCAQWKMSAKERYCGDFRVKTHKPALVISNTYDPVAPVIAGKNLTAALKGSVFLEQNGFGHTSIAQSSLCTLKAVKDYFVHGTLPKVGTVCQVDESLFPGNSTASSSKRSVQLSSEDKALVDAARSLRERFSRAHMPSLSR